MSVAVGDKVLLPEYGGTKIEIESKEFTIFRESDLIAKFGKE
jgi:chaperonin GroES